MASVRSSNEERRLDMRPGELVQAIEEYNKTAYFPENVETLLVMLEGSVEIIEDKSLLQSAVLLTKDLILLMIEAYKWKRSQVNK